MTTIKIHDAEWFDKHCCTSVKADAMFKRLRPKGAQWKKLEETKDVVYWLGGGLMHTLAGKERKVKFIDKQERASAIYSAKYVVEDYWIPNWAIEWVKED